jgi:glycosyltransferase involved in cell wall biosynthesis
VNILYLCEEYPPGQNGGIGSMVQLLARELVRQGHRVWALGLYPHGYGQPDMAVDEGVTVYRMRYQTDWGLIRNDFSLADNLLYRAWRLTGLLQWDARRSAQKLFARVRQLVGQHQIDIIEMPDWNTFLHHGRPIAVPPLGAPLVVKLHGGHSYLRHEAGQPAVPHIFAAEKALLQRADALAAVSRYTARQAAALFELQQQVTVLHNGIAMPPGNLTTQDRIEGHIVFAGALSANKGVPVLLQAWHTVNRQQPGAQLHLYGKGSVTQLKKLLKGPAAASVHFHGHQPRETVLRAFATATAAVFPSRSECFSLAPLEAMAAGCPVIYTSQSAGPELVAHRQNGLLVNPNSAEAIADALLELLRDAGLRQQLAQAGQRTVAERFNIPTIAAQHIDFYQRVMAAAGR